jgi:hypothetical protein
MMNKLKGAVMTRAMKLMTDPKVMKVLSNPKVTQAVMQGMMLKGRVEEMWADRSAYVARQLNLATQQEVDELKAEIERLRTKPVPPSQEGMTP